MNEIISAKSKKIKEAIRIGIVKFDHLGGASALRQKASFYNAGACLLQCFIDDDKSGRSAVQRAVDDKVLRVRDVNLCMVPHLEEAELEDLYDKALYAPSFLAEFGVDLKKKPLGNKKEKWSRVTETMFRQAGKPWNDHIKSQTKYWLARFAAENGSRIVKEQLSGPIDSFIRTVEEKLPVG